MALVGGSVSTYTRSRPSECFQPGRERFFYHGSRTAFKLLRADRLEIRLEQSTVVLVGDPLAGGARLGDPVARLLLVAGHRVRAGEGLVGEREVELVELVDGGLAEIEAAPRMVERRLRAGRARRRRASTAIRRAPR